MKLLALEQNNIQQGVICAVIIGLCNPGHRSHINRGKFFEGENSAIVP